MAAAIGNEPEGRKMFRPRAFFTKVKRSFLVSLIFSYGETVLAAEGCRGLADVRMMLEVLAV
jgi:hypothetical protein